MCHCKISRGTKVWNGTFSCSVQREQAFRAANSPLASSGSWPQPATCDYFPWPIANESVSRGPQSRWCHTILYRMYVLELHYSTTRIASSFLWYKSLVKPWISKSTTDDQRPTTTTPMSSARLVLCQDYSRTEGKPILRLTISTYWLLFGRLEWQSAKKCYWI